MTAAEKEFADYLIKGIAQAIRPIQYLTVAEYAKAVKMSRRWVTDRFKAEELEGEYFGTDIRIRADAKWKPKVSEAKLGKAA